MRFRRQDPAHRGASEQRSHRHPHDPGADDTDLV